MMSKIIYKIQFFDYWHAGSGLAGSTYADSIVHKTDDELPMIPGRTVKGLLRDAAKTIHGFDNSLITNQFMVDVFGEVNLPTTCFFSNATLSQKLAEKIIQENRQYALYQVLSSTQIDADGQAKEGSLRQLEVTIPIILYGMIDDFPNNHSYKAQIIHCLNWVKQLGLNRNRGLGRCQFSIIE
jgi:CRISPR/Cas system CSM-associated protein Csm3 (group 7 of RAMP superfamily)